MNLLYKVIVLFISLKSFSQDVNRKDLITQLKADKESTFVINGMGFSFSDSLKLDSELSKIDTKKIAEIIILKNKGQVTYLRSDVIVIQYATQLPKKIIKTSLKEIKLKFKDEYISFSQHVYYDAKDPVLYLNGNKIHHTEAKKQINRQKINDIAYIYFSKTPQSEEYHGQNAKNGVVIIWTKDKLTNRNK
ncbi:hypothetical protein HX001_02020 [Empedobacter brevis]|uniref:Uncharacterized protein n=1 Tax=Empedobacter brevis TaxID=247 RepID=A0AAJ1QC88_9FLAO|nr:hypothetical protein [Empedobacter brevis]MDM1071262.1 hypothetical protein [Empedobacter brevis]